MFIFSQSQYPKELVEWASHGSGFNKIKSESKQNTPFYGFETQLSNPIKLVTAPNISVWQWFPSVPYTDIVCKAEITQDDIQYWISRNVCWSDNNSTAIFKNNTLLHKFMRKVNQIPSRLPPNPVAVKLSQISHAFSV